MFSPLLATLFIYTMNSQYVMIVHDVNTLIMVQYRKMSLQSITELLQT